MRSRLTIHAAGLLAGAVATFAWYEWAIARPLERSRYAAEAESLLAERRAAVADLVTRRDRAAVERSSLEAQRRTLVIRLLPPSALNRRIGALTLLAEAEGLRIERIAPGPPVEAGPATKVPLRLGARGGSVAAIRFIAALRRDHPDIAIEGFLISGREGEADAAIGFDCVWYAERDGGAVPVAAAGP